MLWIKDSTITSLINLEENYASTMHFKIINQDPDSHLKSWVLIDNKYCISTPCLLQLENIELCSQIFFFIITMTKNILFHKGKLGLFGSKKILPAKHFKENIEHAKMQKPENIESLYIWRQPRLKDKDLKTALDTAGSLCALPAHMLKNIL